MYILLVEDESSISSFIKRGLEENGMRVDQAFDGDIALKLASRNTYDLILLDSIIPVINGLEVCKRIRKDFSDSTPIIMLTALGTSEDIIEGLNHGADDYLTKPFKFNELVARISAVTRRASKSAYLEESDLILGDLSIDNKSKQVTREGVKIDLTAKEYNLLYYLVKNKNRVLSRSNILENVWDVNFDFGTNVVDVYINYLRKKVDKPFKEKLINTVVGMGYVAKKN